MVVSRLLVATVFAASSFVVVDSANADEPVHAQVLLQSTSSWDGTPYQSYPTGAPELSVLKITIPAHTALPWHTHAIPNAAYVLSGELTVERQSDGRTMTIKQGDVLPELVGQLHRGIAGDTPVVLIVFYAGTKGVPLSQIQKMAPGAEASAVTDK